MSANTSKTISAILALSVTLPVLCACNADINPTNETSLPTTEATTTEETTTMETTKETIPTETPSMPLS